MPAPDAVGETVERFLRDIESLRERLAVDLARRNPALNEEQLNVAVQRTLVRVAFLRVCEERGIEPAGRPESLDEPLQGLLGRLGGPESAQ